MKQMLFLIHLLIGFVFAGASAFTTAYSRRWGERGGQLATIILRNVLGIPLWFLGFILAWFTQAPLLFVPNRGIKLDNRKGDKDDGGELIAKGRFLCLRGRRV